MIKRAVTCPIGKRVKDRRGFGFSAGPPFSPARTTCSEVRMGCSTSTETTGREGSRPGTKPKESNGAAEHHCDNSGISEDTETIPDSNHLNEEPPARKTLEADAKIDEPEPPPEEDNVVETTGPDPAGSTEEQLTVDPDPAHSTGEQPTVDPDPAHSTEEQPSQEVPSSEAQDIGEDGVAAPEHTTDTTVTEAQAESTSPEEMPAPPENE
ncbi:fibrous sheath CABYR-binding protein-like [Arapaima gigas]